ncbi:hypothetical protein Rsub_03965 [Raphidocelis subcapitata]|uniref:Uncharacterized protein n=1 Tax=Raphidocelis subcapitata TaxID=307507 RepID=A0A2V0NVK7_9CHLO|nr:hypothetical protein Rsub_03965 [Raphidocelis subcapitata]|eukprot:GBF91661.1 hypothetical protein Rsub_03965 [Raphidocelis subcapitata]
MISLASSASRAAPGTSGGPLPAPALGPARPCLHRAARHGGAAICAASAASAASAALRKPLSGARRTPRRLARVHAASQAASSTVQRLTDELRILETERDEAVKTAEQCARTSVKLEEMVQLLDNLALEKMKEDDEAGARAVLHEKASTRDVLDRTNARAQTHYQLASKLAEKIGLVQAQLVELLTPGGGAAAAASSSSGGASAGGPAAAAAPKEAAPEPAAPPAPEPEGSAPGTSFYGAGAYGAGGYGAGGYGAGGGDGGAWGYTPKRPAWQASIEAARERIKSAEAVAAAAAAAAVAEGQAAAWQARESIDQARDRLRRQAAEGVAEAQQRVRSKANESIAEARARIAAEDAAVLAKVQALMARYRRGDYVTEDELEWAFRQLERRFLI